MLDPELTARLDEISLKADKAYKSAEKVRKYILWTGIISIAFFVLPLIGLMFVIPSFINSYVTPINNLTGTTQAQNETQLLKTLGL